jgi:hypothetical protein
LVGTIALYPDGQKNFNKKIHGYRKATNQKFGLDLKT